MKSVLVMLAAVVLLVLCNTKESYRDVSAKPWASQAIGERYEVIGKVYGYGMREYSSAPVDYVLITAPPGVGGTTVAWEEPVRKGSVLTVRKVLKSNRILEHDINLVVDLEGTPLPDAAPRTIRLVRANQGRGEVDLNPEIYRKLPRS